jgi:hypothetical protein
MLYVLPELKLYLCLCYIPFLHTPVTLTCNITVIMYIFVCVPHVQLNWHWVNNWNENEVSLVTINGHTAHDKLPHVLLLKIDSMIGALIYGIWIQLHVFKALWRCCFIFVSLPLVLLSGYWCHYFHSFNHYFHSFNFEFCNYDYAFLSVSLIY